MELTEQIFSLKCFMITLLLFAILPLWILLRTSSLLSRIPGPTANSFILGHSLQVGGAELSKTFDQWHKEFGHIVKLKWLFGVNMLLVSDPFAVARMLAPEEPFVKLESARQDVKLMVGPGLVWAAGHDHRRQKRILSPAFSRVQVNELLPSILGYGEALCKALQKVCEDGPVTADMHPWMFHTLLDIISDVAFGLKVDSLQNPDSQLAVIYKNLMQIFFGKMSFGKIIRIKLMPYLPHFFVKALGLLWPESYAREAALRSALADAASVAEETIAKKLKGIKNGEELGKDLLSLLVKANEAEGPNRRMNREEMIAQITTFID